MRLMQKNSCTRQSGCLRDLSGQFLTPYPRKNEPVLGAILLRRRIAKRVCSSASGGMVGYTRFVYHGGHVAFETD